MPPTTKPGYYEKIAFGLVLQLSRLDFKRQQLGVGPVLSLPAGR